MSETTVASRFRSPKCVYLWKCGSRLTTESVIVSRPQEVTESDGHVTVLASAACVQPMRSYEGKTRSHATREVHPLVVSGHLSYERRSGRRKEMAALATGVKAPDFELKTTDGKQ